MTTVLKKRIQSILKDRQAVYTGVVIAQQSNGTVVSLGKYIHANGVKWEVYSSILAKNRGHHWLPKELRPRSPLADKIAALESFMLRRWYVYFIKSAMERFCEYAEKNVIPVRHTSFHNCTNYTEDTRKAESISVNSPDLEKMYDRVFSCYAIHILHYVEHWSYDDLDNFRQFDQQWWLKIG